MFPISDDNPSRITPFVTWALIGASVLVFLWQASLGGQTGEAAVYALGMIPARLFGFSQLTGELAIVPAWATIFTSMFMHGGWMHLGGNMLFLWIFGDNVEDAMGHLRFLMFYLMCGIFAGLLHTAIMSSSDIPVIGASGSVAGVVAAYLMLHPRVKIWVLALWRVPLKISAAWVLGFWILLQLFSAVTSSGEGIAWWAHVGGLGAGAVLILFMRRRGVKLFDQTQGGA